MMASAKLYVGNLSYNTTQETLTQLFSGEGRTVKDVFLATDKISGRSRGFAFVEMEDSAANAAIKALNGKEVESRELTVNEARPRDERPAGGGNNRGNRNSW